MNVKSFGLAMMILASTIWARTWIYHVGNSWTDQGLATHSIAQAFGDSTTAGIASIPGSSLSWTYDHPGGSIQVDPFTSYGKYTASTFLEALPGNKWDFLILQPWDRGVESDAQYGGYFADSAYKGNPNTVTLIMACGPLIPDTALYSSKYDNGAVGENSHTRSYYEALVDTLKRRYPTKKFGIVPLGNMFSEIDKRILSGKGFPGVSRISDLFLIPDGHYSSLGKYVEAVVQYTVIYQRNPKDAITSDLYFWQARYSVPRPFADSVWSLAWQIVQTNPYCRFTSQTGVSQGSPAVHAVIRSAVREETMFSIDGRHVQPTRLNRGVCVSRNGVLVNAALRRGRTSK